MITREGNRYLIEGPVTLAGVTALLTEGERIFDGNPAVVDFSKVTEVDSSAVSLMLEWARRMRGNKREIVFVNLGHSVASIADLYGVADLIPVPAE